jgi:hypothetical protein
MGGLLSGLLPVVGNLLTGVISVLVHALLWHECLVCGPTPDSQSVGGRAANNSLRSSDTKMVNREAVRMILQPVINIVTGLLTVAGDLLHVLSGGLL